MKTPQESRSLPESDFLAPPSTRVRRRKKQLRQWNSEPHQNSQKLEAIKRRRRRRSILPGGAGSKTAVKDACAATAQMEQNSIVLPEMRPDLSATEDGILPIVYCSASESLSTCSERTCADSTKSVTDTANICNSSTSSQSASSINNTAYHFATSATNSESATCGGKRSRLQCRKGTRKRKRKAKKTTVVDFREMMTAYQPNTGTMGPLPAIGIIAHTVSNSSSSSSCSSSSGSSVNDSSNSTTSSSDICSPSVTTDNVNNHMRRCGEKKEESGDKYDIDEVEMYGQALAIPRYRKRALKRLNRKEQLKNTNKSKVKSINKFLRILGLHDKYVVDFQIEGTYVFHAERVDLRMQALKDAAKNDCEVTPANYERALKIVYHKDIKGKRIPGCTAEETALREIAFCKRVDNVQYFMQYYNAHYNIQSGTLIISMEYSDFGDILRWIRNYDGGLSEDKALSIFKQIADGVKYLHDRDIAHRDLKLENIAFCKYDKGTRFKILDFGLACDVKHDRVDILNMGCGSTRYISYTMAAHVRSWRTGKMTREGQPGAWATQKGTLWDPRKNDVWSLGLVLFMLLHGRLAYMPPQNDVTRLATTIETTKLRISPAHSKSVHRLLRRMLKRDEEKRFTINDVLKHPWMNQTSRVSKSTADLPLSARDRSAMFRRRQRSIEI